MIVHFCPAISSIKDNVIPACLLSSYYAMTEYPQNFNLVTLKSKYVISIQGVRRHLINSNTCYCYHFVLIIVFTVAGQWCRLLRLKKIFFILIGI